MAKNIVKKCIYNYICIDIAKICAFINRYLCNFAVVPYMGTWIEIFRIFHPPISFYVVPYMGTWIEISLNPAIFFQPSVVPYMGTWIEILVSAKSCLVVTRRSLYGNVD